jgi:PD-(D/E)XK nuclease superfamily protein
MIEHMAATSRPDVQPQVVQALRRTFPIIEHLTTHPNNLPRASEDLMRYDGGEGQHAGQLAADILPALDDGSRGPVRGTGELDLLLATVSPEELEMVDFKSGWREWNAGEVAESFQFQMYAWLVLQNYPAVQRVRVRVYITRAGEFTGAVEFTRRQDHVEVSRRRSRRRSGLAVAREVLDL